MLTLLLVDDESYVVEDLAATIPWSELQIEEVFTASSGAEALQIMEHTAIDIVVTDISMPGMSGIELAETIRRQYKRTKCILLSGYAEFDYARKALSHEVSEYLLKPISDADFMATIRNVADQMRDEWKALASYDQAIRTFEEHLPLLKDKLLNELLQGRSTNSPSLAEQLDKYRIPFFQGDRISVMLIRLEEFFLKHDTDSLLLFEYAIDNIARETFSEQFQLWSCKDIHEMLVYVVTPKRSPFDSTDTSDHALESLASQLQRNVNIYLGGGISVVTGKWGTFPEGIQAIYQDSLAALRKRIGKDKGYFLSLSGDPEPLSVQTIRSLYEPPTLIHLYESGRWDAFEEKLYSIFREIRSEWNDSQEHLMETYTVLSSAFYYIAHKNGRLLSDMAGAPLPPEHLRSIQLVEEWTFRMVSGIRKELEYEVKHSKSALVQTIHQFVEAHLSTVTLQTIAAHVSLHPAYLSKVYKTETGQSISELIYNAKMDKAAYLLKNFSDKIYEISSELGYSNAHYFIKVFKERYGVTPQEYRDQV
ncbi:two-component system response regulator YesN [Paenibacillus mucilaginosus]|uniref:response regulator transcription factor n=1 Tax=Paenibacillus mucilaginosus TaxID=61624 RepID=UPI003D1D2005